MLQHIFQTYRIFLYCIIWTMIIVVSGYILIKEDSIQISLVELQEILQRQDIVEILIDSKETYFYEANGRIYKIPSQSLITAKTLHFKDSIQQEHDKKNSESFSIELVFHNAPIIKAKVSIERKILYMCCILVVGLCGIMYFGNKKSDKDNKQSSHTNIYTDTESLHDMSLSIQPMQSLVRFSDVAGINQAKDDLLEIIDYLKNPKKYQDLGIYLPRGVLLIGPPGVGKTMIAKAIAGESGVPFFYQSGSSFVQMYVGVGAQRVRDLFAKARANAPAIIFIDEIDAVGKARGGENNHEWESTLNELLTEMDGFGEQSGVIVIAATNQVEVLDAALLRSGRFDRRIYVDLPDLQEREEILRVHLKNRPYNLDLHEVAKLCIGFSGANISSLINEAAINALRHKRQEISMQDIMDTSDKVLFGKKRQHTLTSKQKQMMAIYNAGKGIAKYWLLDNMQKVSLMQIPTDITIHEYSMKSDLISQIKIALSGNLALEVNNFEFSTIAKQDLHNAKYIATKMCEEYGMGERLIANEEDILNLLETLMNEQREFIDSHKKTIDVVAHILMEHEEISKEEIKHILESSIYVN